MRLSSIAGICRYTSYIVRRWLHTQEISHLSYVLNYLKDVEHQAWTPEWEIVQNLEQRQHDPNHNDHSPLVVAQVQAHQLDSNFPVIPIPEEGISYQATPKWRPVFAIYGPAPSLSLRASTEWMAHGLLQDSTTSL